MLRHLDLLNVFLALRFKQPGYPDCLSKLGYLVPSVGVTFVLGDGTKLAPDVVAQSPGLTLLTEVKGGKDLDGDQLSRMLRVTATDLRDFAYLHVPDPSAHRVHVLYVCNDECRAAIAEGLGARIATVAGFDGERFRFSGSQLPDAALSRCMADARMKEAPPLAIVPFDAQSEEGDVAGVVIPEIVGALVAGAGTISAADILGRTHAVVGSIMQSTGAGSEHATLLRRVKNTIDRMAAGELAPWIDRVPRLPAYRFKVDLPVEPAARTRELQRIRTAAAKYLAAQQPGKQVQLPLLFEVDIPAEARDEPGEPTEGPQSD
ncbi:MAG TPA: hypothetical protein VGG39_06080 [Polyangiaceae bacterium]|jgi:hypothetical protein